MDTFERALSDESRLFMRRLLVEHTRAVESTLGDCTTELDRLRRENSQLRAETAKLEKQLQDSTVEWCAQMRNLAVVMRDTAQQIRTAECEHDLEKRVPEGVAKESWAEEDEGRDAEHEAIAREPEIEENCRIALLEEHEGSEKRLKESMQEERGLMKSETAKATEEKVSGNSRAIVQAEGNSEMAEVDRNASKERKGETAEVEKKAVEGEKSERGADQMMHRYKRRETMPNGELIEFGQPKLFGPDASHIEIESSSRSDSQLEVRSEIGSSSRSDSQLEVRSEIGSSSRSDSQLDVALAPLRDQPSDKGPCWIVVGGAECGGLLVRQKKDLTSAPLLDRLKTGATVEQLRCDGKRLRYRRITGDGPDHGWVSIEVESKVLLRPLPEDGVGPKPVFALRGPS